MKILLQHLLTNSYLCDGGSWSNNPDEGFDFGHTQRAIDYSRANRLGAVRLAVRFADSVCDTLYTVPASGLASDAVQLTDFC